MTILLYDHCELEERTTKHLRVWKAWHLVLFIFAALFGIINYVFLQNTKELVDKHCVFYPRNLSFHMIPVFDNETFVNGPNFTKMLNKTLKGRNKKIVQKIEVVNNTSESSDEINQKPKVERDVDEQNTTDSDEENKTVEIEKETKQLFSRTVIEEEKDEIEVTITVDNVTVIIANKTHFYVLNTNRTLFAKESDCDFAEYMPIISTVFALVWISLFTMCPSGGKGTSGMQQPWRILSPALVFALVMVALTGHGFATTNRGLQAFCATFRNVTNTTTCSSVDPFLRKSWDTVWGFGGRASALRAASAGVWASWACAAALLLARCLVAPDFRPRPMGVYLTKDPKQIITPYLKKTSSRRSQRSNLSTPSHLEVSSRSEPTATTELVTASVEHEADTAPTSLQTSPIRDHLNGDAIEMKYHPQERERVRFEEYNSPIDN